MKSDKGIKMKIGFVSTTISIACLASSTEARLGASRNLVDKNVVEGTFVDSTRAGAVGVKNFDVTEGVATASGSASSKTQESIDEHHSQDEQDTTKKNSEEQPKALPSFDKVMHEDAPKHGMYVEGGSDRIRSFCARHNHFGPNSGCEQHQASLRGSRVGKGKAGSNTNSDKYQ